MRAFLKILATMIIGAALGVGVTWYALMHGGGTGGDVQNGPWRTSLLTGSNQSGDFQRAFVALHGLLALNRNETIYYSATTDDAGKRLDGAHCYAIEGRDPPTRWWSVTVYGADDFLIPDSAHRYAVSKNSVARDGGRFVIAASRDPKGANVLATGGGAFSLTLRLYNPDPKVAADPAHVALPAIREMACR